MAVPLCLPNNCQWNEDTNEYSNLPDMQRNTLHTINAALRRLRTIQGPVCVVAVAGPCRIGKSYILAKSFDDTEIFPLGNLMVPKTMGLWLWISPEKFHDPEGNEFTVVLIDSEGTNATQGTQRDDDVIFTLTVLLSSVLIYNSSGVPRRSDLEGLDHMIKLSQRIQVFAGEKTEETHAQKVFPAFVWLLRDVLLGIPDDCKNILDYFLKKVFKSNQPSSSTSADTKAQQAADSILKYFPSFDAFSLPLPSTDPKVIGELNEQSARGKVNSGFLSGIEDFKCMLYSILRPKMAPDGSFVTGEALATMIETYIAAVNTPGTIPSIAGAWDTYIDQKGSTTLGDAKAIYQQHVWDELHGQLPCPSEIIRAINLRALKPAEEFFENETDGIAKQKLWEYKRDLQLEAENTESEWLIENNRLTEESCKKLLRRLRKEILDPVHKIWRRVEGHEVQYAIVCMESAFEELLDAFRRDSRGCRELCQNFAYLSKEELDKEKRDEIERIKTLGRLDDEKKAWQIAQEEEEDEAKRIGEENPQIRQRKLEIELQIKKLELEHDINLRAMEDDMEEKLRMRSQEDEDALRTYRERGRLENQAMKQRAEALKRQADRWNAELRNRETEIGDLEAKIARLR